MISMDKTYTTRDRRRVKILSISREHDYYPVVADVFRPDATRGSIYLYTREGKYLADSPEDHVLDLVESAYEDYKIDDPVMVRTKEGKDWVRRYFAGVRNSLPTTFRSGATSWSSDGAIFAWSHCRRPTTTELEIKK